MKQLMYIGTSDPYLIVVTPHDGADKVVTCPTKHALDDLIHSLKAEQSIDQITIYEKQMTYKKGWETNA